MRKGTLAGSLKFAFLGTHDTEEERTRRTVEALVAFGELSKEVFTYAERVAAEINKRQMKFIDNDDVIRFSRQKPMRSPSDFNFNDVYWWVKIILRDQGILRSASHSHTATKYAEVRD
jgi:hypothetical protein